MSTINGSSTSTGFKPFAATGPKILAHLLLLQQQHRLPDWTTLEVNVSQRAVELRFAAPADLDRWVVAMGKDPEHINRGARTDGAEQAWIVVQIGTWKIDCEGITARSSKLDADTVAGLETVAANPEQSETRVSDERVQEIVAELNRITSGGDNWWDWIADMPEFDREATHAATDSGELHLVDGTVLVWEQKPTAWVVSA